MIRYRIYIIFSIIIALGVSAIFLVSQGYYPVALVEGDFVSAYEFAREYRAATIYYQNLLKTYGAAFEEKEKISSADLELAVINSLIENNLIAKGARAETGEDFEYLLENKLSKFVGDAELEKAALALYGLEGNEFREDVLIPQAEREILAGRLFLRGEKIEDWLASTKQAAQVIIFSPQFEWNGESVVTQQ
ncbi:MAG: hypothetical protein AAB897_00935 [Patescibacteria group bacterium]